MKILAYIQADMAIVIDTIIDIVHTNTVIDIDIIHGICMIMSHRGHGITIGEDLMIIHKFNLYFPK